MKLAPEIIERMLANGATFGPVAGSTATQPEPEQLSEKDFMAAVIREAKRHGWRVYHTHDSRKSEKGFPDLCMVRGPVLVFMELKSENGRPTAEQLSWMEDLSKVERCGVHLFYPKDWNVIAEVLK